MNRIFKLNFLWIPKYFLVDSYDVTRQRNMKNVPSFNLYLMKFYSCSTPTFDYAESDEKLLYTNLFHFCSRLKTLHKLIKQEYLWSLEFSLKFKILLTTYTLENKKELCLFHFTNIASQFASKKLTFLTIFSSIGIDLIISSFLFNKLFAWCDVPFIKIYL